jgi:cysteinyl-tRNA synthetase
MPHPPMAKYWMHGGLLLFENQKMSKSLGNFEPLSALLERHDPQAIRLLFLQTGYRKVMNFTEESIGAATVTLERLKKMYRSMPLDTRGGTGKPGPLLSAIEKALDEDFNTAVALSEIVGYKGSDASEFAYALQLLGIAPDASWGEEPAVELPADLAHKLGETLGAAFNGSSPEDAIAAVIAMRTQARAEKNWGESDRLRDILLANGVALKDSKDGTTWSIAAQK